MRTHHPGATGSLGELFAGYGERPSWPRRQAAMLDKCRRMLALRAPLGSTDPGCARWRSLLATTTGWTECDGA